MSTVPAPRRAQIVYPSSDGKPMAETDIHRILMIRLIEILNLFYADQPWVYVSGNLLVYYEKGNRRKHVSPDVFVAFGVEKRRRDNYLLWEERAGPRVVIELTSKTTRKEDRETKFAIYRDVLKVREYFLFDPKAEYLKPRLQGYRLRGGVYRKIRPVQKRLPSQRLGLHLEADGENLRLWNPAAGVYLPTQAELTQRAEAEVARLRRLLEEGGISPDEKR